MARISIDDELHKERRYKNLVKHYGGDEDKAIGILYRFWHLAQDYWGKECALMPLEEFREEGFDVLLEPGTAWAVLEGSGVKATGSETRFAWYLQKCRASRAGVEARVGKKPAADRPEPPEGGGSGKIKPRGDSSQSETASGQPEQCSRSTGDGAPVNPSLRSAPLPSATDPLRSDPASGQSTENVDNSREGSGQAVFGQTNAAVISRNLGKWSRHQGLKPLRIDEDPEARRRELQNQAKRLQDEERANGGLARGDPKVASLR